LFLVVSFAINQVNTLISMLTKWSKPN